jgi:hypothetical protein
MTEESYFDLQQRTKDAVENVIHGSSFGPPSGEAVLLDCVVVMGWTNGNGEYRSTHLRCGSPWATEGLLTEALRFVEDPIDEIITGEDEDDDEGGLNA